MVDGLCVGCLAAQLPRPTVPFREDDTDTAGGVWPIHAGRLEGDMAIMPRAIVRKTQT
jgi:hypothetical protein